MSNKNKDIFITISYVFCNILHVSNVVIFFVTYDLQIFIICALYLLIISLTTRFLTKRKKLPLPCFLMTMFVLIIGPIDILVFQVSPFNVAGYFFSRYLGTIDFAEFYWSYFFYSIGMYLIILISFLFFDRLTINNSRSILVSYTGGYKTSNKKIFYR